MHDRPRRLILRVLLFLLLAPARVVAQDADVAGWGETRWGMTGRDIDALFGDRLQRVDPPLVYADATVGRILPQAEFGGVPFRALFQMDRGGRLRQVLLERRDGQATPAAFQAALGELRDSYGEADAICGTPRVGTEASPVERERVWVLPTTTIHLSFLDYRGGVLYRDPQQDIDPLVSELDTRLYARRSLPRRLLVRFHPTARENLMGDCRPEPAE